MRARGIASMTLCVLLAAAYTCRSDALYALTIWPAFGWVVPGLAILLYRRRNWRTWWLGVPLVGWLAFLGVFCEEARSVARGVLSGPSAGPRLRVTTLNCAGGTAAAAEEVAAWRPELVLLQEAPTEADLAALAKRLFGTRAAWMSGPDCAIACRGRLRELGNSRQEIDHVVAVWARDSGEKILVVSLRLQPPVFRLDYWNPACWQAFAEDRRGRRTELAAIWVSLPRDLPTIIGGDFNTPPDPGTLAPLASSLADSFASAGRGWPGTAPNDYPFARIDQVWVSGHFSPTDARAVKTLHSDHRMVVVDLETASRDESPTPERPTR